MLHKRLDSDTITVNCGALSVVEGSTVNCQLLYIGRRFKNDTERLEKLFELYTKMTAQSAPKKVCQT